MNDQLKKAIEAVGGIEEAKRIIAEMEKPEKWDRARCGTEFLRIIDGMQLRRHPDRPGVNLWDGLVGGERVTLFEQDLGTGIVWCRWHYVWRVFKIHSGGGYTNVQALLKDLMEEHLKWRVETPDHLRLRRLPGMEEHLKWRVETPLHDLAHAHLRWKNTSDGR